MADYDVILSPVFAQPVIGLGMIDLSPADISSWTAAITGYSPFTALANWTGVPAMSLPLGTTPTACRSGSWSPGATGPRGCCSRSPRRSRRRRHGTRRPAAMKV